MVKMPDYKKILQLHVRGYSKTDIAAAVQSCRATVRDVLAKAGDRISELAASDLDNEQLLAILYPEKNNDEAAYVMPDCEKIHSELARKGVNMSLLWTEYQIRCRQDGTRPYMYSQYCDTYRKWALKNKATMRIHHKPGDAMEVDWAGGTLKITDPVTGNTRDAYLFAGVLPCSCYTYAELTRDMTTENFLLCHSHAYAYFGGVPRLLIPDNLKAGVTKNTRFETIIPRSYSELADFYDTAIVPARVKAPKDKSHAEGGVKFATTWILAALRNEVFFSFEEAALKVSEKLEELNARKFEKRTGCRRTAFLEEEKEFLQPLPGSLYEPAVWTSATVPLDYNVTDGTNNYSVPYELIGEKVDIRTTRDMVEIYFNGRRVASHYRHMIKEKDPIMIKDHMPEKHRRYLEYNQDDFMAKAKAMGSYVEQTAAYFLGSGKEPEQGFKFCVSLISLGERYGAECLDRACRECLESNGRPQLRVISSLVKNTRLSDCTVKNVDDAGYLKGKGLTRGAAHFIKGGNET